jgi:CarD family transcriptional regulator
MFRIGDRVIHPSYGVGTVIEIEERHTLGNSKRYYSIELLGQPETIVMVPVGAEERVGLRHPVPAARLGQVWHVLQGDPNELPSNHDKRCELVLEKLHGGDVLKIAEVVRDLAWWREEKRRLTIRGKRLYDRGMALLAGEVASARGGDLQAAEHQISRALDKSLHPAIQVQ